MLIFSRSRSAVRPLAVWLVVTVALTGCARLALPGLGGALHATEFADLLVAGCAAASLGAGIRLWLVTTAVVLDLLRRRPPPGPAGRLRTAVLLACGAAVLVTASPAGATPRPVSPLDGLPLPDRAVGAGVAPADGSREAAGTAPTVRVRPGDSLWAIAERALGPGATAARVAAYWPRIQARNADVIGDDPDLIQPDQRLVLPPTDQEDTWKR